METSTINCAHKFYTHWVKLHTHVANVNAKRKNFWKFTIWKRKCTDTVKPKRVPNKKSKKVRSACLLINWTQLFSLHPQQKTTHSICRFIPVSTVGKTLDCTQRVLHLMQLPPWLVTCKNQLKIQINSVQTKLHWHWQGDFVFSGNQTGCCECRKWCQAKKLRESLQTCSCLHNISPHVRFQNKQGATQLNVWTVTLHFPKRNKQMFCVFRPNHVFVLTWCFHRHVVACANRGKKLTSNFECTMASV